ncbi:MAG: asparagine synthase (glutamine-hydrolyzing) [Bacilli bacterium]|nr:asparagine synthase (glutamine-hydrolyzing) [Bacilli bacterium]
MCGINGIVTKAGKKEENLKNIKKMNNMIIHRGPNAEGIYASDKVTLGHRRLSIIDLEGGNQPIYNEDGKIMIVFNGEIFNYKELKKELSHYKYKTNSDTEVLLHAYEEWGFKFLTKIRGMFAFAIYDQKENYVLLARDHFGIKPLYYYQNSDTILFASEIKSLLVHPKFKKELNKEMLGAYLTFSFTPGERTFFKNVYKLPAGTYMTINPDTHNHRIEKFFNLSFSSTDESFTDVVNDISLVMKDSVKHHLISDVEVGSFLSSGIDSSYLVSLAKPDKTYTVGYNDKKYSEIDNARDLCERLGINNTSSIITMEDYFKAVPDVFYHMDEPTTDACSIAVYFLSKLASKDVKVVLSGEGADELFGGYNSYDDHPYTKLPLWIRKTIGGICYLLPRNKYTRYLIRRSLSLEEGYVSINRNFYDDELKKVLNFKDYLKNMDITREIYEEFKNESELNKKLAIDIKYWLPDNVLNIVDKMTMAYSLESRVPFTDIEVFKISSKLGQKHKIRDGQTKASLRAAAKKVIPNDSYKKKKLGFPVPIREWIKDDLFYNDIKITFNMDIAEELFKKDYILKLLENHKNGVEDNYRKVWAIYSFLKWYKVYFIDDIDKYAK